MLFVAALVVFAPSSASAWQGGPVADAGESTPATPAPTSPAPSQSSQAPDRPVRGPAVRERGGRRSRGASTASGALMLTILIGAMAYYVIKRIRR